MKNIFVIGLCLLLALPALAQKEGKPRYDKEKLKAAKIAFITQRVDITPDQATKFWPLYNEFEEKRDEKVGELRRISQQDKDELTNEKAQSLIQQRFKIRQDLLELEKGFTNKASNILTPIQVFELHEVDRDFVRHLYKMHKRKHRDDDKETTGFLPLPHKFKNEHSPTLFQLAENLASSSRPIYCAPSCN